MRGSAARACHVQITPAQDDPVVFARALISAIASVAPDFDPRVADSVAAAGSEVGRVFVSRLLVGIEELDGELVIVLDDVHRLANRAIWADLDQVIERLPDNVRIVLSARWDPPVRLRSLQLLSRVVEIRAGDLAFDAEEARDLIEAVSGRQLTEDQTDALVARTDGWAAGLQLAAISLQRFADADAFIDGFTGSNKLVADYLAEEVIDELEPDVRRFLLHTSVLEWLSADVCNAVTGDRDAEEMLDMLARRSLFLVQPDRSGERLRYHHLFADLLRDRLRATEPDEEPRLRRRAATYLLGHGQLADAIEQLLAAGDGSQVVRVIVERGQGFFEREENLTLARWLTTAKAQTVDVPVALEVNLLAAQLAGHDTGAAVETYRRLRRRTDLDAGETAAAAALYTCLVLNDLPSSEVHRAADESAELLRTSEVVTDFLGIGGRDTVEFLAAAMTAMAQLHDGELADERQRIRGRPRPAGRASTGCGRSSRSVGVPSRSPSPGERRRPELMHPPRLPSPKPTASPTTTAWRTPTSRWHASAWTNGTATPPPITSTSPRRGSAARVAPRCAASRSSCGSNTSPPASGRAERWTSCGHRRRSRSGRASSSSSSGPRSCSCSCAPASSARLGR